MRDTEVVCSRGQVCQLLNTRLSRLDKILPELPRPRAQGEAGKLRVRDLEAIRDRP